MSTLPIRHDRLPAWPRPEDFTVEARHADQGAITVGCPVPGCNWADQVGGHHLLLKDLLRRAQVHIDNETGAP